MKKTLLKDQHPVANRKCKFWLTNGKVFVGQLLRETLSRGAAIISTDGSPYYFENKDPDCGFEKLKEWEYC